MRQLLVTGVILLLAFVIAGCTEKPKEIHTLDCVLHSVDNPVLGEEVVFEREYAIKNGYVYHFSIYDNGRLVVNNEGEYLKDMTRARTYQMFFNNKVLPNMEYTFNEDFSDVYFFIHKNGIKYSYDCNTTIDFKSVTFRR
ncbi:MAG: hypothetical protein ABFR02_00430 [Campylobacterota bacterium]